jgi:ammonium transporter, Amt family
LSVGLFAVGDYGANYNGIPAHGVTGILPIGAVGTPGYFTEIGWHQLLCQVFEVGAAIVVGFGIMFPFFKLSNLILPLRVSKDVELQGLDMPEMGALGYPDFELKTTASVSEMSTPLPNGTSVHATVKV